MSKFSIVSISPEAGTIVINWGSVTLNHFIPVELAGADSLSVAEIEEQIEAMRPVAPEPVKVPAALAAMVQPVAPDPDALERAWRDAELASVMWLRERHRDQVEISVQTTLSAEQFAALLVYMQDLRDWPQSTDFPDIEHRPVAPAWVADQTE